MPVAKLDVLDIRLGNIERVEAIGRSGQWMKLTVNFGDHTRLILAGICKERDNPKEIKGQQARLVLNLEPPTAAGEISWGMLFDPGYADANVPALAMPERRLPDGTRGGELLPFNPQ